MCTVTYVPLADNGYILTSNRDEHILRPALPFQEYEIGNKKIYFPKDSQAGGTWIAHDPQGYSLCLLNGAFTAHIPAGNYRRSRGLVLLDFFSYPSPQSFSDNYDFEGIEPFTLVLLKGGELEKEAAELRWDGNKTYFTKLDPDKPEIWSSATLYAPATIEGRRKSFSKWINDHKLYSQEAIVKFHRSGDSKQVSFVVDGGDRKTVSISSIFRTKQNTSIHYWDLLRDNNQELIL